MKLKNHINYEINPRHYRFDTISYQGCILAKFQLESTRGEPYETYILFLHMENINCYDVLLSQPTFHLKYICAITEGLAFGGCSKSIITHIFEEGHINSLTKPIQYSVVGTDFTFDVFHEHVYQYYEDVNKIGNYLKGNNCDIQRATGVYHLQNRKIQ